MRLFNCCKKKISLASQDRLAPEDELSDSEYGTDETPSACASFFTKCCNFFKNCGKTTPRTRDMGEMVAELSDTGTPPSNDYEPLASTGKISV